MTKVVDFLKTNKKWVLATVAAAVAFAGALGYTIPTQVVDVVTSLVN
jgi:hypothetical protein